MPRNRDEDLEDEIRAAFERSKPGDVLKVCRWNCRSAVCAMCASVTVVYDMTFEDVLDQAKAHRA